MAQVVLIKDEGIKYSPYLDHKGNWTILVGHYIGADPKNLKLSYEAAIAQLDVDLKNHYDDLCEILGADLVDSLSTVRLVALLSVKFTMSRRSFSGFQKMIEAIRAAQWDRAAAELLDSGWAKDVDPKQTDQGRDNRLAFMLKTDRIHPDYEGD